ncbi:MAG TPA: histidine--tRNA ligase [bacterium]
MNAKKTRISTLQPPAGFKDILPDISNIWQFTEQVCREIFDNSGYKEIRTPILEKTQLFERSIGNETDIVQKEMYTFTDRSGDTLSMRPEGTAPAVRAYIEHSLGLTEQIFKIYYIGQMFRHERPQKGRLRQFHQIGAEIFNVKEPAAEVELLIILNGIFDKLNVKNKRVQLNSVGCPDCRPEYLNKLRIFLESSHAKLCNNCQRRMNTNPLRVLDCKEEECIPIIKTAPVIMDYLCSLCSEHFKKLQALLKETGIAFEINTKLVRGLDYYTRSAFEIISETGGSQNAIAAGGRYDNLVESMGGEPTPAAGFAIGVERLIDIADIKNKFLNPLLFVLSLGAAASAAGLKIASNLRERGIYVEFGYNERSLKSQLRRANKLGARFVLIIGENEMKSGAVTLKNMEAGTQESISLKDINHLAELVISSKK